MDARYSIRPARLEDLSRLGDVERAANTRFAGQALGARTGALVTPLEELAEGLAGGLLWVAERDGEVVGFALAMRLGDDAHLHEMDVHPDHGRRGVGRALVETVCAWARAAGRPTLTLTTLEGIPWNAPFYRALGFRVLARDEIAPPLRELMGREALRGLDEKERVAMSRDL
jgi:GNAT superfamily N-acetyltransferase